jgi:hypothetical protein
LSSDLVLKKGGYIVVDKMVWKGVGVVLDASKGDFPSSSSDEEEEDAFETAELRKDRRAR